MEDPAGKMMSSRRDMHPPEPDLEVLPNFFLIGVAKAGTTSLFDMLVKHPEIYGPPEKETRFFNDDGKFHKGTGWYQKNYYRNARHFPIRCDATPAYLIWSSKVAPRIHSLYGDTPIKFAVIFRDPVHQAYSHYWQRVRQGVEELSFTEALEAEDTRLAKHWVEFERSGNGKYGYFRAGRYASLLDPFLERFPRERFHFLKYEDLQQADSAKITGLLEFLEVNTNIAIQSEHSNPAVMPKNRRLYSLFRRYRKSFPANLLRKLVSREQRHHLREMLNDRLLVPYSYPPMESEVERVLRDRYAQEMQKLEHITGWDLSTWLPAKNNGQGLQ